MTAAQNQHDVDPIGADEHEDLCGGSHVIRHAIAIARLRDQQQQSKEERAALWGKFDAFKGEVKQDIKESHSALSEQLSENRKSIKALAWKVSIIIAVLLALIKGSTIGLEEILRGLGMLHGGGG